ncbi:uncharacterized protein LOC132169596 [Corylus avellana]|uniref:uncharacterized protein LOC132169596 n=1 Tax=Corylus avellana TaxID=13451 RepID=UPI001E204439|nr:uncharacterized protein LOC132169596 [Corylus avellana]
MASSPLIKKPHARSNSLPSRPHPLILDCNEHLCRLEASASSSSLSSKLIGLQDLHDCVEKLLQIPQMQKAFVERCNGKWVEELLDGSLRLLDMCSAAKDALIHTKECARELQSIMRRRAGGDMGLEREVRKFFNSRKVVKKAIQKALKGMEGKHADKKHETLPMVSTLREIEAVTLTVFESLLSFVAGPRLPSKLSSWSLVSKLVLPKRVVNENEETNTSEFEKVDAALHSLISHNTNKTSKSDYITHVENVHNLLGTKEIDWNHTLIT